VQYVEYAVLGVCCLIFLAVVAFVVIALVAQSMRGPKKAPVATLYPIPPAERGTGQHTSLLGLFDQHRAEMIAEKAREDLRRKLFDLIQETPPKA
jgi:hypothetical protein